MAATEQDHAEATHDDLEASRWSDWEDEDDIPVKCLFSNHMCENVAAVVSRTKEKFGFDMMRVCEELNLLVRLYACELYLCAQI